MKICVFSVHNTLNECHVVASLSSLGTSGVEWDKLIVYNTHDEITNDKIISFIPTNVKQIEILTPSVDKKTLHQDLINIFEHLNDSWETYSVLFLKADYCLSKKFNVGFERFGALGANVCWSLPILNAKESVGMEEISVILNEATFPISNDKVYYRTGNNLQGLTPPVSVLSRNGKDDADPSVKFVGHNVIDDYNVHCFDNVAISAAANILHLLRPDDKWTDATNFFRGLISSGTKVWSDRSAFAVHMFHAVDRNDIRKNIPGQRY